MQTAPASSLRRLALVALAAGTFAAVAPHARAVLAVTDQSNTVGGYLASSMSLSSPAANAFGQSFTPTLAAMNAATFSLETNGVFPADTVTLNVYAGDGFGGALLTTSNPVIFTNTGFATVEFDLPGVLLLTPGNVYTLGVTLGAHGFMSGAYGGGNPYAGGIPYFGGSPNFAYDTVFAEGVTSTSLLPGASGGVPEPSTWALLLTAAGAFGLMLKRGVLRA